VSANVIVVVNHPRDFPSSIPGAHVVSASTYLTDPSYGETRSARVLNLCRADRYQGRGYYVSLLAEARGHRPIPEVKAIRDLQTSDFDHLLSEDTLAQIRQLLATCSDQVLEVDAYFGHDPEGRSEVLCQQLFSELHVPLLRAAFEQRDGQWHLREMRILSAGDIPDAKRTTMVEYAL